jgi:hypothetical protein
MSVANNLQLRFVTSTPGIGLAVAVRAQLAAFRLQPFGDQPKPEIAAIRVFASHDEKLCDGRPFMGTGRHLAALLSVSEGPPGEAEPTLTVGDAVALVVVRLKLRPVITATESVIGLVAEAT